MASIGPALRPTSLAKEGDEGLRIDWNDGHHGRIRWRTLRDQCPCAGCREEREAPPNPFRILKPSELAPLRPLAIAPVGFYAYKITWSDGHDSGIFTLDFLREHCECKECAR